MSVETASGPIVEDELVSASVDAAPGSGVLPEATAKALLRSAGIRVPAGVQVDDIAAAPASVAEPLVLKAVSPTLVHKSDAGGVRVGLTRAELAAAAAQMRTRVEAAGHEITGFLVEEQAPCGQELVVGAVRTPGVGWVVMVGLGGIFVEVLADVSFGVAPLRSDDVHRMVRDLRGHALLSGTRGTAAVDVEAFVDLVVRLAGADGLLAQLPETVVEVDLNPVIVTESAAIAVDARFVRGEAIRATTRRRRGRTDFAALFAPRTVAILGAKSAGANGANLFIRNLRAGGYDGRIVPVHPTAQTIEGIAAVPSLAAVEGEVDYAYVVLPRDRVADALAAGEGRVHFAQVVSSGFGEVADGVGLERELVERMRPLGTRVVGPNCLGTHSSKGRLGFIPEAPFERGGAAVISQSGGLSVDMLRLGSARGLGFHSVVSFGNGADVTAAELLTAHLDDPEVRVVGLYLESLAEGAAVLDVLRDHDGATPVVLLAGGRTSAGAVAATSHTGALAGNHRVWPALARQAGATLVDTLEEFVDVLLAFETADPGVEVTGTDVVLFGNGGGASVLAADALQRRGLGSPRLDAETITRLEALELPPGNGLHNPIDVPAGTLAVKGGAIAEDILVTVLATSAPAVVISHLNVGIIQRNLEGTLGDVTGRIIEAIGRARDAAAHRSHHLLVLKPDGKPDIDEQIRGYARRARALGLPAFPSFEDAAVAAQALVAHQERTSADPATPIANDKEPQR